MYNPSDPCYQTCKSFIKVVCPNCSKMEVLFKLQKYRKGKHYELLDNFECMQAVLKDMYG